MVVQARISGRTKRELGPALVDRVLAHLWAQDCQTCGQALGRSAPSLVVHDYLGTASASLHHRGCQRATWQQGSSMSVVVAGLSAA